MKNFRLPVLQASCFFALLVALTAHAGGESSSGGGAMVCRDAQGNIVSAQLLDLWEIQFNKNHAEVIRTEEDIETQIANTIERVKVGVGSGAAEELRAAITELRSQIMEVKPGIELSPPYDALNDFVQSGCKLEGVALYSDRRGQLFINPEILKALPKTDQAALLVHEAVYRAKRRSFKDTNSIPSRETVGWLFSTAFAPLRIDAESYILCEGTRNKYIFIKNEAECSHLGICSPFNMSWPGTLADMTTHFPRISKSPATDLLDFVDRELSDGEFQKARSIYDKCRRYTPGCDLMAFDLFVIGVPGTSPETGAMMTLNFDQSLYADIDNNPDMSKTLFTYEVSYSGFWKRERKEEFTRNEAVKPLCKRYNTSERPMPW